MSYMHNHHHHIITGDEIKERRLDYPQLGLAVTKDDAESFVNQNMKRNLRRPLDLEDHYVSHDYQEQLQKPNSEYKSEKFDAKTPAIVIKKPDIVTCGDGYTVGRFGIELFTFV